MLKSILTLSLLAAFSGCATTGTPTQSTDSGSNWLLTGQHLTWLSSNHSAILNKAATGSTIALGSTPWGKNTRVVRNTDYFAASGNRCFRSVIRAAGQSPQPVILCKYPNALWGATPALPTATVRPKGKATGGAS